MGKDRKKKNGDFYKLAKRLNDRRSKNSLSHRNHFRFVPGSRIVKFP